MKQNRLRALVRTLGVLALAVFGAATASAQFGKIDGRVKNAAGAPISPAATVSLVGQTFTTTTNKDGYYFFLNVPSGVYTISVTAIGFRGTELREVRVITNETNTRDFTLEPQGAVTLNAITATASVPLVNPNKSTSMQVLDADYVKNLPEQRIATLLSLQPGVSRPLTGDTTRLSVRGGRYTENIMYLDGIPQQQLTTSGIALDIATNAFEDVTLTTGAAGAQFGGAIGGVINITTRSGGANYQTSLRWDTGMVGGKYATGSNNFEFGLSGPVPFLSQLRFSTTARLEGQSWTNTGYQGWLFPVYGTVGVDTTFTVPRANTATGSVVFNNSRADSVQYRVYQTAVLSGDCDKFFFVKDASLAEMRDNYGVSCEKSRTFVSPNTSYRMSGRLDYAFGGGSRVSLSYNYNGSQSRDRLVQDGRASGTVSGAHSAALSWSQTLFRSNNRSLAVNASYSLQRNATNNSPITVESEKASRHPFGGFLLKPLDQVYHEKDFPIDSTIIKAFLTQSPYRTSLIPTSSPNTGAQEVADVSSTFPGDGVPYRSANSGGASDVTGFSWNWEVRKILTVGLDAQVDRYNRVTAQFQRTTAESKNFAGSASGTRWYRPELANASLEDKLDLGDVVVTAGVRYDRFNYNLKRWVGFPRISTAKDFDPANPDLVMAEDKAHDYVAPRIQVAFPVTAKTNFRLSYSQAVGIPPLNNIAQNHHSDFSRSGVNSRSSFGDDISFSKVILFEFGVAHAFNDNMVLDVALYNRDNLANAQFKYGKRVDPQSNELQQLYLLQNSDFGNSRGIEVSLDRQIGSYMNGRLNYSYSDVKNTGSDPTSFLNFFEGIISGDGEPPATPLPVSQSTPHTLNGTVTVGLPADFKRGTLLGKVLGGTRASATFQLQSGTPYTRCDPAIQSNVSLTVPLNSNGGTGSCSTIDAVQGYNQSRLPMTKSLNTQFGRNFRIGKFDMSAYLNVNNILNLTNTRRVYATTGTTSNPALFLDQWRSDSISFLNAGTNHGFTSGDQLVLPTSTANCAKQSNASISLVESCFYWVRSEQRFGNGDGIYTLDEWRRVSEVVHLKDNHISNFINGFRSMRFGMTVAF